MLGVAITTINSSNMTNDTLYTTGQKNNDIVIMKQLKKWEVKYPLNLRIKSC